MPNSIPQEMQDEFVNDVDSYLHRSLKNSKRRYERSERRFKQLLYLNKTINEDGEEMIDYVVGCEDIEPHFDFLNSIDNDKLYYCLTHMHPRKRMLLKLKFYDELTNEEIAKLLGLKKRTISQTISNIICNMRETMK